MSGLLSPSYPTTMAGSGRKNVEEEVATSGVQDRNRDPGRLQGLAASRGGRSEEPAAGSSECPPSFLSPCPLLRFPDSQAHVPAESTRELRKARLPPGQPLGPHADTSRPRKLAPRSPGSARSWRDHLRQRETTADRVPRVCLCQLPLSAPIRSTLFSTQSLSGSQKIAGFPKDKHSQVASGLNTPWQPEWGEGLTPAGPRAREK